MSDYYVGMKHENFLANNRDNIRNTDRVFDCEGGNVSQYNGTMAESSLSYGSRGSINSASCILKNKRG